MTSWRAWTSSSQRSPRSSNRFRVSFVTRLTFRTGCPTAPCVATREVDMGLLNNIGLRHDTDKSSRFHNYLDFYEQQLPDRSFDGRLLEIGVMDGYSMAMWREYYPDAADIIGLDIMPKD